MRPTLILLTLLGCADQADLADIEVDTAYLRDLRIDSFGVVGGWSAGRAKLDIETPEHRYYSVPVRLGGTIFGIAFEMTWDIDREDDMLLFPPPTEGPHTADVLLGRYKGTHLAAGMGYGLTTRSLHNKAGSTFNAPHDAVAIGIMLAHESLRIRTVDETEELDTGDVGYGF